MPLHQAHPAAKGRVGRLVSRTWLAVVGITIIPLVVSAVSARAWLKGKRSSKEPVSVAMQSTLTVNEPTYVPRARLSLKADTTDIAQTQFDVERISVRPTGFDPAQIVRPRKGPFFLIVENRTGLRELSFQVETELGIRLSTRAMLSARGKIFWKGIVDLPPGRYKLTELGNRDKQPVMWSFTLIINP